MALAASEWGSRCEYISPPDNQLGQNMNYFYGADFHASAIDLFRASFTAWANKSTDQDSRKYRYCGQQNICSYVQVGLKIIQSAVVDTRSKNPFVSLRSKAKLKHSKSNFNTNGFRTPVCFIYTHSYTKP